MFIKTQEQNTKQSPEKPLTSAVIVSEEKKLTDALSLYLQSIQANQNQPAWIYGNSITLSAQINRFDIGIKLKEKAEQIYRQSDEISRAIALLYEKQDKLEDAIEYYQKSIDLNPLQPEWVYQKVYNFLIESRLLQQAEDIRKQGAKHYPKSFTGNNISAEVNITSVEQMDCHSVADVNNLTIRTMPKSIEHNVDLNVEKIRHQLMDSSLVQKYEILLEQTLCHVDENQKSIDTDALLHCLAQIKTDIHYLKTKLFDPDPAIVDPQAKRNVDIEKIISLSPAVPIKCDLKNRIVGTGWHAAEEHGRWTGSGTISSIVLPYPLAAKYRLEIVVRGEAKPGLLKTLKVTINDKTLSMFGEVQNSFPTLISQEIVIPEQNQPFLSVNLIVAEIARARDSDARLIGLLVESISLIPLS